MQGLDNRLTALIGLAVVLAIHLIILQLGSGDKRRRLPTTLALMAALDLALIVGMAAGHSIATEETPFWSLGTMLWGLLGGLFLFVPAWLLARFALTLSGIFLIPAMPTDYENREQAGKSLRSYIWGSNGPVYAEVEGRLRKRVGGSRSHRQAGPGLVIASSHYAIPLTTGPRDTRVGGHGLVFTGPKERPHGLIDLRLQTHAKKVHALTRDGISINVVMQVVFEIDRRRASGPGLYPFDPSAVRRAMHARGIGPDKEVGWEELVTESAADALRDTLARQSLDQLLSSDDNGTPARAVIEEAVAAEAAKQLASHGIDVKAIALGTIEVENSSVLAQRVDSWAARWRRRRLEREAEGNAEAIGLLEKARADVQSEMIKAITDALDQLADTEPPVPSNLVALRLIDVLEDLTASPQMRLPRTIEQIPSRSRPAAEANVPSNDQEQENEDNPDA